MRLQLEGLHAEDDVLRAEPQVLEGAAGAREHRVHRPAEGLWPSAWIPGKIDQARAKYAHLLELEVGDL